MSNNIIQLNEQVIKTELKDIQSAAFTTIVSVIKGIAGQENHWTWHKFGCFINYYHTSFRNGEHMQYGLPKSNKFKAN